MGACGSKSTSPPSAALKGKEGTASKGGEASIKRNNDEIHNNNNNNNFIDNIEVGVDPDDQYDDNENDDKSPTSKRESKGIEQTDDDPSTRTMMAPPQALILGKERPISSTTKTKNQWPVVSPSTTSSLSSFGGFGADAAPASTTTNRMSQSERSTVPVSTGTLPPPSPSRFSANGSFSSSFQRGGQYQSAASNMSAVSANGGGMSRSDRSYFPTSTGTLPPPSPSIFSLVGRDDQSASHMSHGTRTTNGSTRKLEVPVKSPKRTQIVTEEDFFDNGENEQEMELEDFEDFVATISPPNNKNCFAQSLSSDRGTNGAASPKSPQANALAKAAMLFESSFAASIEEASIKSPNYHNTRPAYQKRNSNLSTSTSSYEEIVLDTDDEDEFEVESIALEQDQEHATEFLTHTNSDSYEEEVIDDDTYEAFIQAQEASAGVLTFDDFLSQVYTQPQIDDDFDDDKREEIKQERSSQKIPADNGFAITTLSPVVAAVSTLTLDLDAFQTSASSPKPTATMTRNSSTATTTPTTPYSNRTTKSPGSMAQIPTVLADPHLHHAPPCTKPLSTGSFTGVELQLQHSNDRNRGAQNCHDALPLSPLSVVPDYSQRSGFTLQMNYSDIPSSSLVSPLTLKGFTSTGKPKRTSNNNDNIAADRLSSKSKESKSHKKSHREKEQRPRNERETSTSRREGNWSSEKHRKTSRKIKGGTEENEKDHREHRRRREKTSEGDSRSSVDAGDQQEKKKSKSHIRHEKEKGDNDLKRRQSKKKEQQETNTNDESHAKQNDKICPSSATAQSRKIKYMPRISSVKDEAKDKSPAQNPTKNEVPSGEATKPVKSHRSNGEVVISRSVKNRRSSVGTVRSRSNSRSGSHHRTIDDNAAASPATKEKRPRDKADRRKIGAESDAGKTSKLVKDKKSEKKARVPDKDQRTKSNGEKKKSSRNSSTKERREKTTKSTHKESRPRKSQ